MTESSRPLKALQNSSGELNHPDILRLTHLAIDVQTLIRELSEINSIPVHHHISQSYYMQKNAELLLLCEQLTAAHQNLSRVLVRSNHHYEEIHRKCADDRQWLHNFKENNTY